MDPTGTDAAAATCRCVSPLSPSASNRSIAASRIAERFSTARACSLRDATTVHLSHYADYMRLYLYNKWPVATEIPPP
ncbi:hypothetical protein GCM10022417_15790 [Corynebacterium pilbarense]